MRVLFFSVLFVVGFALIYTAFAQEILEGVNVNPDGSTSTPKIEFTSDAISESFLQYATPRTNYAPSYLQDKITITSEQDTKRQLDLILSRLLKIEHEIHTSCSR